MSAANYLEQLLNNQPIEWKKLGEVCTRTKGTRITASRMKDMNKENAPIKIFAGGKTYAFVDYADIPEKDVYSLPSVIVKSRGIIEFEYYDKPFSHKAEMWSYASNSSKLNIKFLYYYLKTQEFQLQRIASKMQMPQIAISDTETLEIPLPPLSVQQRIVEILDEFTEKQAELEQKLKEELALRKKQYEYYRNQLLNFSSTPPRKIKDIYTDSRQNSQVTWKKLGEVCEVLRGKRVTKKDMLEDGSYIVYQNSLIPMGRYNEYNVEATTFVICAGSSSGSVGFCADKFWVADDVTYFKTPDNLLQKFVYYYLLDQEAKIKQKVRKAGMPRLSLDVLRQWEIPLPPLEEQARIVAILDKFDALTCSIAEGLPLEIELRQKQYAYYREQLLNFRR